MWWCGNNTPSGTKAVGTKQANQYGVYDMHGNVWEWMNDWYGSYTSSAQTDPMGPGSGSYRVSRGGGWRFSLGNTRSALRDNTAPGSLDGHVGFRPARSQ
jgi:formylglycine-generating enzyme required for sulfatase activity